jgi:glucose-1-phosphate thymidylyltransferase
MKKRFKIIIPIAGEGTRLRPHTLTMPKPLIPVAGKPMLAHILDPLVELNPDEVVFVVGYLGEVLTDYIKSHYRFNATFIRQDDLLGLGYAVNMALEQIEPAPLMVILGDTIAHTDFNKFLDSDFNRVGLKEVDDPRRFGVAVIRDNKVVELEEKPANPRSNLAVIGLYYFNDTALLREHLAKLIKADKKTGGEIQLTDAMDGLIKEGRIFEPFMVDGWYDCGKKETLLETNRRLLNLDNRNTTMPGSKIIPPVIIAPTATIKNSVIGPYVSISEEAVVEDSTISNSIVFEKAVVRDSRLEASLVGRQAILSGVHGSIDVGEAARQSQ